MFVTAARSLKFTQWPNDAPLEDYNLSGGDIVSVSWSKNNAFMICLEREGLPHILSLKDPKNIKVIHIITAIDHASVALFSRNRNGTVAIGTALGTVALYDTHSKTIMKLYDVPGPVLGLDFNCCDKYLGVICQSGQVIALDLNCYNVAFQIDVQEIPSGIRFHPYVQDSFGICTTSGKFMFVDVHQAEPLWTVAVSKAKALNSFAFYPKQDKQIAVTVDEEYRVSTIDTIGGKCLFRCFLQSPLTAVDYSNDAKYYGVGTANGKVCIFESSNPRTPVYTMNIHEKHRIHCLRFSSMSSQPSQMVTHTTPTASSKSQTNSTSTARNTICGTDVTTETLLSLLSKDQITIFMQNLKEDVDVELNEYISEVNNHVDNQLKALDEFIRSEFDKIEAVMQEKWNLLKIMRATTVKIINADVAASEDDVDENLLDEDPSIRESDVLVLE